MSKLTLWVFFIIGLTVDRGVSALGNSTESIDKSSASSIIYGTSLLVVGVIVVLCNGTVVFVILKTDNPYVSSLTVIAHMAFWDLIQGLLILVFVTPSAFMNRFVYSIPMINWAALLWSFVTGVGQFNTVTIVVDRLVSLKQPFFYRKHATKGTFTLIASCVYILALIRMLCMALPIADFRYDDISAICFPLMKPIQRAVAIVCPTALAFLAIFVSSCVILRDVSRRRRRVNSELTVPVSHNVAKRSLICVLSAGLFCLSYVPLGFLAIFRFALENVVEYNILFKFAIVAYLANSIWNVLIYSLNYKPFREAFLKLFCRSYYRRIKRNKQLDPKPTGRTEMSRLKVPKVVLTGRSTVTPLDSLSNLPTKLA